MQILTRKMAKLHREKYRIAFDAMNTKGYGPTEVGAVLYPFLRTNLDFKYARLTTERLHTFLQFNVIVPNHLWTQQTSTCECYSRQLEEDELPYGFFEELSKQYVQWFIGRRNEQPVWQVSLFVPKFSEPVSKSFSHKQSCETAHLNLAHSVEQDEFTSTESFG